jgi:hypothetical protein
LSRLRPIAWYSKIPPGNAGVKAFPPRNGWRIQNNEAQISGNPVLGAARICSSVQDKIYYLEPECPSNQ